MIYLGPSFGVDIARECLLGNLVGLESGDVENIFLARNMGLSYMCGLKMDRILSIRLLYVCEPSRVFWVATHDIRGVELLYLINII